MIRMVVKRYSKTKCSQNTSRGSFAEKSSSTRRLCCCSAGKPHTRRVHYARPLAGPRISGTVRFHVPSSLQRAHTSRCSLPYFTFLLFFSSSSFGLLVPLFHFLASFLFQPRYYHFFPLALVCCSIPFGTPISGLLRDCEASNIVGSTEKGRLLCVGLYTSLGTLRPIARRPEAITRESAQCCGCAFSRLIIIR